jgi:hypothetical protein
MAKNRADMMDFDGFGIKRGKLGKRKIQQSQWIS